jgi:hypothetical protein
MSNIAMVSACLWDLRAQCEQQLRSLTHAQRLADEFRECPITRALLKPRLVRDVEAVLRTNGIVREAAGDCANMVGRLTAADDQAALESQRRQAHAVPD